MKTFLSRFKERCIEALLSGPNVMPTVRLNRLSRFCEIVALVDFAYLLQAFVFWLMGYAPDLYVVILAIPLCILASWASVWFSSLAISYVRRRIYCISDRCLSTLKALNIPADVAEYLERFLKYRDFVGEEEFLNALKRTLGYERAREFREMILKYARKMPTDKTSPSFSYWDLYYSGKR
jgi:hypothetical protein